MIKLNTMLHENAIKSMDTLHKILILWILIALVVAFLPNNTDSAQLKLPLLDLFVPYNLTRWIAALIIFTIGFVARELLRQFEQVCTLLKDSDELTAVLTYPSIVTLGTSNLRGFIGVVFAFTQYSIALTLIPELDIFGGSARLGLAFLYSMPMLWFGVALRRK